MSISAALIQTNMRYKIRILIAINLCLQSEEHGHQVNTKWVLYGITEVNRQIGVDRNLQITALLKLSIKGTI